MKLSRFLSVVSFITCFSLLYVYQQTEVFRLAYVGQKKQARFEDLLDKNSILRYNIERKASLTCIGTGLSEHTDYEMPNSYRLVRLTPYRPVVRSKVQAASKETLLSRLFGIKTQAEAKTINP